MGLVSRATSMTLLTRANSFLLSRLVLSQCVRVDVLVPIAAKVGTNFVAAFVLAWDTVGFQSLCVSVAAFVCAASCECPHVCYGEIIAWDGKKSPPNLSQACIFERLVRNFREVVRDDLQAIFPTSQLKGQVRIPSVATPTTRTFFRNVLRTPYQMQPSPTATRRMTITQASTSKLRREGAHSCL